MTANRTKKIEDEAWELLDNAPEDSVLEGSSDLVHSSDLREEVEDLSSVPLAIHLCSSLLKQKLWSIIR